MASQEYEQGKRDGRIEAIERRQDYHEARMDNHERRLVYLERIIWGLTGILALTSVLPDLMEFFHVASAK